MFKNPKNERPEETAQALDFEYEIFETLWVQNQRNFATNLKEHLRNKGLTQAAFAKSIGVRATAITKWLNGHVPCAGKLQLTARACGRSMDDMLYLPSVEFGAFCIRPAGPGIGLFENNIQLSLHPIWQLAIHEMIVRVIPMLPLADYQI
jgi:transcriptional regulator with XRE-family HTH domain